MIDYIISRNVLKTIVAAACRSDRNVWSDSHLRGRIHKAVEDTDQIDAFEMQTVNGPGCILVQANAPLPTSSVLEAYPYGTFACVFDYLIGHELGLSGDEVADSRIHSTGVTVGVVDDRIETRGIEHREEKENKERRGDSRTALTSRR